MYVAHIKPSPHISFNIYFCEVFACLNTVFSIFPSIFRFAFSFFIARLPLHSVTIAILILFIINPNNIWHCDDVGEIANTTVSKTTKGNENKTAAKETSDIRIYLSTMVEARIQRHHTHTIHIQHK